MTLFQPMNENARKKLYIELRDNAHPDLFFYVMVVLSCTIATFGLLMNSVAVIIGAMLIAPLMTPIVAGSLAITLGNTRLLRSSVKAEITGVLLAITISVFLTLMSPSKELTGEILARTQPTLIDLIIALASGAAGAYAMCFRPGGAALPGVAIATALMPPLCVVGIGLAVGNNSVAGGAFLLFLANLIAISIASSGVFRLAGFTSRFKHESEATQVPAFFKNRLALSITLLVLISIPLVGIMNQVVTNQKTEKLIKNTLAESISIVPGTDLVDVKFQHTHEDYQIRAVLRSSKIFKSENVRQLENVLEYKLGKPVTLSTQVVLIQDVTTEATVHAYDELFPKQKETAPVIAPSWGEEPEEIINQVVSEKLKLIPETLLIDFTFSYQRSNGTYIVNLYIQGPQPLDEKFQSTVSKILEERLKRRVVLAISFTPAGEEQHKAEQPQPQDNLQEVPGILPPSTQNN